MALLKLVFLEGQRANSFFQSDMCLLGNFSLTSPTMSDSCVRVVSVRGEGMCV